MPRYAGDALLARALAALECSSAMKKISSASDLHLRRLRVNRRASRMLHSNLKMECVLHSIIVTNVIIYRQNLHTLT